MSKHIISNLSCIVVIVVSYQDATSKSSGTLLLALGVDVPRADEDPALLVLGELVLAGAYLLVNPRVSDLGRCLPVAYAPVLGLHVGGATCQDDTGVVAIAAAAPPLGHLGPRAATRLLVPPPGRECAWEETCFSTID